MTKEEVIQALESGKNVYWSNLGYQVMRYQYDDGTPQYLVKCLFNNTFVGLFNRQGELADNPEKYFVA
jgi:hypothetical protein